MENKMLLKSCCEQMEIPLSDEMAEQFMVYKSLLLEWNEKMNLTAITEEREVILKHFVDCLSLVPYLKVSESTRMIDVGTGAGFPGLPVKIVCPQVSMTLLDSLQKRIGFLEESINAMGLSYVECVHSRAEDGGQNPLYREQFDYCVSRAVANLAVLSEYCLPFVKVGGTLAALKGPDALAELTQAEGALKKLGGKVTEVISVTIPFTDLSHKLVFIEKIAPTPKQYPRKAGKISKSPLK
ncbi:16S rRNA (guanine(527)-N(7))-methyltransferase RsmG [Anaerotignum sp. MB30-C6]|uniref:16S rRNA (guanine(527)-N(7))-methyltransferase RsmG n=1 Tax=Anaerotignum sp. MB30-C6 TaxID=3070814 RepID=UPI0027DC108D|nr:16S rRNA (guanine(527)-N(7))-methyltransferase RsmG [Anaerotignum sp. MB30-C6]WMI81138.1 16S rRNA (guanine(527)-N(7))-methyltransferase RsmG [Anaerotignum sp. MB30-C6]